MRILGIDTVTRVGSLAVVDSGEIITQGTVDTTLNHAASLISVLDNLLESINTDISKIDAVAVDVGPGSFTGIRVGIASAKGLTEPNNKRLAGVSSLEVLCYEVLKKGFPLTPALSPEVPFGRGGIGEGRYLIPFIDAKRGGIYTGWYRTENDEVQVAKGPYLTTIKKLFGEAPANSYIFGPDAEMIEKDSVFPSAGIVAWLAEKKINEGLKEKSVEPMYIYDVEYRKS